MRFFVAIGATVLVQSTAVAQTPITFAGIPHGATIAVARPKLQAQGFVFKKRDTQGDYWFEGQLKGQTTDVLVLTTGAGTVAKIILNLRTPDESARRVYYELVETLTQKYGEPSDKIARFLDPYYEGDGYEEQAIRLEKGQFMAVWDHGTSVLGAQITKGLTVELGYEYPAWDPEYKRRRTKANDIF
jgi:hypothetical protein